MIKLVFATHNEHNIKEIQQILPDYEILSLEHLGIIEELIENGNTLEENAAIKANYVFNKTALNCFADDTGLEVSALNGAPGLHSARYAGENNDPRKNMNKLLLEMKGVSDRRARFKTVVCLILNSKQYFFEGIVEGEICNEAVGVAGFGYDPIFRPKDSDKTFAEMLPVEKNAISHRGRAMKQLVDFILKNT